MSTNTNKLVDTSMSHIRIMSGDGRANDTETTAQAMNHKLQRGTAYRRGEVTHRAHTVQGSGIGSGSRHTGLLSEPLKMPFSGGSCGFGTVLSLSWHVVSHSYWVLGSNG